MPCHSNQEWLNYLLLFPRISNKTISTSARPRDDKVSLESKPSILTVQLLIRAKDSVQGQLYMFSLTIKPSVSVHKALTSKSKASEKAVSHFNLEGKQKHVGHKVTISTD